MKPVIGVTLAMGKDERGYSVHADNPNAIMCAGGMPILLPYYEQDAVIRDIAKTIDGLVTTGGDDIDPTLFGEEPHPNLGLVVAARDHFEIAITKQMLALNKPVLAICRGAQILNIATGGDMYQDMAGQIDRDLIQHQQQSARSQSTHEVTVVSGTLLHHITKQDKIRVNSMHHQANRHVKGDMQVCGTARDGIIEAIESKHHSFVLGVQWHPESMATVHDTVSLEIYNAFIKACKE